MNFEDRKLALQQKKKKKKEKKRKGKRVSPFVTQYQPRAPYLKQILMKEWHFIENQAERHF